MLYNVCEKRIFTIKILAPNLMLGLNTFIHKLRCAYYSYFLDKERTSYIKMRKQNTCWCYETETCTYLTVLIKMVGYSTADG